MAAPHENLVLLLNALKKAFFRQEAVYSVESLWTMIEQPSIHNSVICKLLHCSPSSSSSSSALLCLHCSIIPLIKPPKAAVCIHACIFLTFLPVCVLHSPGTRMQCFYDFSALVFLEKSIAHKGQHQSSETRL